MHPQRLIPEGLAAAYSRMYRSMAVSPHTMT
jgi:hypothetical protein